MRVVFLPEGGFSNAGGFIEVEEGAEICGDEKVYQRQAFLTLRLKCMDVEIIHGVSARTEMKEEDADPSLRRSFRTIVATGEIQESRWMKHSLSFLGRKREHDTISVSIREHPNGEAVFAAGMPGDSDLDTEHDESFFVEVVLAKDRMDVISREVQIEGAELWVEIQLWKFQRFYATWSPAIDEGRTIKFLDSGRDVENADDIPEEFWNRDIHRKGVSDPEDPPVTVSVRRKIGKE